MKKRRDLMQAIKEDSRISSLEGNLRRLTSEVEAYRRFSERSQEQIGSKNHEEQLQQLLQDEQQKTEELRKELAKTREDSAARQEEDKHAQAAEISALQEEVARLQAELENSEAKTTEALTSARIHGGPATEANAARRKQMENDLRLVEIKCKDLERSRDREKRRADRAEEEVKSLREQLNDLHREQRVKDAQLDSMRTDLQDLLARDDRESKSQSGGTTAFDNGSMSARSTKFVDNECVGNDSECDEEFDSALAEEMESMRCSYESKLGALQEELEDKKHELKELRNELKNSRRPLGGF